MSIHQVYMDTGYGPIDEEHHSISEQLRALLAAANADDLAQTRAVCHVIFKNVASHFAHEERLMDQWKYPKAERHREAHASFLNDAGQFVAELEASGVTPRFPHAAHAALRPHARARPSAARVSADPPGPSRGRPPSRAPRAP